MKGTKYIIKIRTYPEGRLVSVWLLEGAGPYECRLYGSIPPGEADKLADALGLPVVRDHMPLEGAEPEFATAPERPLPEAGQGTLFDNEEAT